MGTDDGHVQLTTDGGSNWTELSARLKGMPKGAWVPQIHASNHDVKEAFVVVNDYRRNNWEPYLFKTSDQGKKWVNLLAGKAVEGYVLSVVQDPVAQNLVFVGTDRGLYFTIDAGQTWTKWMKDFPSVPTRDMKIHPREHDLVIGTFGRAAFVLDNILPLL